MNDEDDILSSEKESAWPLSIRLIQAEKRMEIDFDNHVTFSYPAAYLRVKSPSAQNRKNRDQAHGQTSELTMQDYQGVGIKNVDPVGNYAVRIVFDDGHSTGLYSWAYLYRIGVEQKQRKVKQDVPESSPDHQS